MNQQVVTLQDKYTFDSGRIYLTGSQALVRVLMVQRRRDMAAGLNTAGFISGYRGSPMTVMDQEMWRAEELAKEHHVKFWPAVNEHMAATAIWGSQQTHFHNDANYDGVYSMWYGKGPGLDQSLDAMRQANYWGSSKHGGVLVLAGDDPAQTSTVDAYHSELLFEDLLMPVLYPADIQDVFDMALYGIALSRFSGAWVGYKLLPETIETAASINAAHDQIQIVTPEFKFPSDGVNSRVGDSWAFQEERLLRYKLPAAVAFARANKLNRVTHDSEMPKFGIAAMGKTWRDALQAIKDLGLSEANLSSMGVRILKVAMPFPVDRETYKEFAAGLSDILVIEDKREQIENALRDVCYHLPEAQRPSIVGRRDEAGLLMTENYGNLHTDRIARIIAARIQKLYVDVDLSGRLNVLDTQLARSQDREALALTRLPYFCSGCPHNSSTKVPEGSRAYGGVGCHFMAYWMDRDVGYATQMGGEGVPWIGQAPFVKTKHVFQQLGDGTYYHSGTLAIRSAVASGVNITYKILFNDAVAMTGGQPVDGPISVPQITNQMRGEGIERIAVVTDEPEKYSTDSNFAAGTTIHHREDLELVQREMREIEGVSILIYDQTCAAEKRRRRKRGTFPDPAKRMFINDRVCEGCGDCSKKSNCVAVLPTETEFGRKRKIDQSACNKDYSCNNGFCPSFVTVLGGDMRKGTAVEGASPDLFNLPEPVIANIPSGGTYGVLSGGVGGTGVITVGALIGMAAHIDKKGVSIVDQMGFAQKGGAVLTHTRIANKPDDINSARINAASADLVLGYDMLTISSDAVLDTFSKRRTTAVINTNKAITGDFTRDPDLQYPSDNVKDRLISVLDSEKTTYLNASDLAVKLLGNSIGANLLLLGFTWQKGLVPLSKTSIYQAIELNGVSPKWNQTAFEWGRCVAHDLDAVIEIANRNSGSQIEFPKTLEQLIEHRTTELTLYQDSKYAQRYLSMVDATKTAESSLDKKNELSMAVARYGYKLMAYKDEYEVGRLYSDPEFKRKLNAEFEGDFKLQFNLSPPSIAPKDKVSGLPKKMTFGPWVLPLFRVLSKLKLLRGTAFDVFGKSSERKMERQLIVDYEETIKTVCSSLNNDNYPLAVQIASLPEKIRGYGHVKEASVTEYHLQLEKMLDAYSKIISLQAGA